MQTVIEIRGLTKTYGTVKALDGLTLSIPRGGVYGILGPNGAGKSTLFRTLLGLIRPTAGEATVMGGRIGDPAATRRMAVASRDGMAMTSIRAAVSRATAAAFSKPPSTGTPSSFEPCSREASSRKATGWYTPVRRSSRTNASPARPAPRINTRDALSWLR